MTDPTHDAPPVITQDAHGYKYDLHLTRDDAGALWAAWVTRDGDTTTVHWRSISEAGEPSALRAVDCAGAACSPRLLVYGETRLLVWSEYSDKRGEILCLDLRRPGAERARLLAAEENLGDFACDGRAGSGAVLVAEAWRGDGVGLRWARFAEGTWRDMGELPGESAFAARPRARAGADSEFLLSWDEYTPSGYRIATAFVREDRPSPVIRTRQDEAWHTMSALAQSDDGAWHLAYSTNQFIEIAAGALGHHSEIRVDRFDRASGAWRRVDAVDIDYAMNPWMAAYVGRRRQPYLLPATGAGVWLLWEMKQDPDSMGPGPGKLLCRRIGGPSQAQTTVAIDGRSAFVPQDTCRGQRPLWVASKTQFKPFDVHLDYALHRVALDGLDEAKPAPRQADHKPFVFAEAREKQTDETDGRRLFFGDPHLHSWVSGDLDGEPDELHHFARDVAELDFVALTENDFTRFTEPLRPDHWQRNKRLADLVNAPGRFTALIGWEYTKMQRPAIGDDVLSHRCVLFPGDDGPVHNWHDGVNTPRELIARLKGTRCLLHHHHGGPLDLTDDTLERNVEICSGWENWMLRPDYVARLYALLAAGLRFGFFGGSDNHERNPGLGGPVTGAWATENTREGIYEAFETRRVFATTGLRPLLIFRVCGELMGGQTTATGAPIVEAAIECHRPVAAIEVIRDGRTVHHRQFDSGCVALSWHDDTCPAGEHIYTLHVTFAGEEPDLPWNLAPVHGVHAWASPVWVTRG